MAGMPGNLNPKSVSDVASKVISSAATPPMAFVGEVFSCRVNVYLASLCSDFLRTSRNWRGLSVVMYITCMSIILLMSFS